MRGYGRGCWHASTLSILLVCITLLPERRAAQPASSANNAVSPAGYDFRVNASQACSGPPPPIPLVEATITGVHAAMLYGTLNCSQLVAGYLQRIAAFDKSTQLNSVRIVAANATSAAAKMDLQLEAVLAGNTSLPPLFCVPMLIKDNFDVVGLASTAGSTSLVDNFPAQNAVSVDRLIAQGAIVLAKTNMGEFAFSPYESVGSLFGMVRNAYNPAHTAAGSSGGSAVGMAANFGLAAMGTDTGNSVRGPASHASVVGLRSTLGMESRRGIVPARHAPRLNRDTNGPLARTVEDVVRIFDAIKGYDPGDNLTHVSLGAPLPSSYLSYLDSQGLVGARIGVVNSIIDISPADPEVTQLFDRALTDMSQAGATIVDYFNITGNTLGANWDGFLDGQGTAYGFWNVNGTWQNLWNCKASFKHDIDIYLAAAAVTNPHLRNKSLQDIYNSGDYDPSIAQGILDALDADYEPWQYPTPEMYDEGFRCGCLDYFDDYCRAEFRQNLIASMNRENVDVITYPTWGDPPWLIGDLEDADEDAGNYSPYIAPHTGSPAITVPMGFNNAGLPAGLQLVGRPWDEGTLFRIAYAYEQATQHRVPPANFPECPRTPGPPAPAAALNPNADISG